jgi:hypothetical protein
MATAGIVLRNSPRQQLDSNMVRNNYATKLQKDFLLQDAGKPTI